jgi:hypothetical protein
VSLLHRLDELEFRPTLPQPPTRMPLVCVECGIPMGGMTESYGPPNWVSGGTRCEECQAARMGKLLEAMAEAGFTPSGSICQLAVRLGVAPRVALEHALARDSLERGEATVDPEGFMVHVACVLARAGHDPLLEAGAPPSWATPAGRDGCPPLERSRC